MDDTNVRPSNVRPTAIDVDVRTQAKLLMICNALDKDIHTLNGKVNMLTLVRYGVNGATFEAIKAQLEG